MCEIGKQSQKDAFRHAFELCWAMIVGVHPLTVETSDEYINMMINNVDTQIANARF